jgi:hypothetical protein
MMTLCIDIDLPRLPPHQREMALRDYEGLLQYT